MFEAYLLNKEEEIDFELQRTAWFTAHIMNSSGNYKKPIKPNKLYESKEERRKKNGKGKRQTKDTIKKEKDALLQIFNIDKEAEGI